jgi:hypothetical protein
MDVTGWPILVGFAAGTLTGLRTSFEPFGIEDAQPRGPTGLNELAVL